MISAEISKWLVLILAIGAVIFLIKVGTRIINLLITALVLAFCWFSFFTEEGSARLSIALTGHPIIAYTTELERQNDISTETITYFISSKDVIVNGKKQEYIKCYTKWIVRIPAVKYNVYD